MGMRESVQSELGRFLYPSLVTELLDAYEEAKKNYYLGGLRLSAVEAGRFCEAAFRLLEHLATGCFTPLGKQLDSDKTISMLASLPSSSFPDAVRLHIPRGLRLVYDIRNKRDNAHLADGIDPNLQDATLVVSVLDWILAEFIRTFHNIPADHAHKLVDSIVTRAAPVVQDFEGFFKILKPKLPVSLHVLLLLYQRGKDGAIYEDLFKWVRPSMRSNLKRTLTKQCNEKDWLHYDGSKYFITRLGEQEIEKKNLLHPL